MGISKNIAT